MKKPLCLASECDRENFSKGYCGRHYQQVRVHGHVLTEEEKKSHYAKQKGVCLNTGRTHFKKNSPSWNKGVKDWTTPEHKENLAAAKRGRPAWNKGLWGFNSGDKNPNWKGGVKSINNALRRTKRYADWRKRVFERDDYTCQQCGDRGVYLEADHIKPFAFFPELRFELSNGQTLCKPCHQATPTYKKHKYQEI